jgi:uncharacterized protein YgbK (DUF1537 family)
VIIGAIGDDFTGSSDLGLMLAKGGMHTVQYVGIPSHPASAYIEAGIVALKTRSAPVEDAVRQSVEALRWLREQGCRQFFLKICSTFDSTPQGNIGPVIEALIDELGSDTPVIVCPAFPETGRTVYQGHLFVSDTLLSESGMEDHPLTPMSDPDIRRWLQHQTSGTVGHVTLGAIRSRKTRQSLIEQKDHGCQIVVCDAIDDSDLLELASAAEGFALMVGGSGLALGLPQLYPTESDALSAWKGEEGPALVLSGSCSKATRNQIVEHQKSGAPQLRVSASDILEGFQTATTALDWALKQAGLPLIYTSDEPQHVSLEQSRFGKERSAKAIEGFFGKLAVGAAKAGMSRIISAGGETSGAVVKALGIEALEIGPMIDPGVPALRVAGRNLVLALKSGNFGAPDFFIKAANVMARP